MKQYFAVINYTQQFMLTISIVLMTFLPPLLVFKPDIVTPYNQTLYELAHLSLLFVMSIRPLADIFTTVKLIRPLVILRKGFGVFSASIIMSYLFGKIALAPADFFSHFISLEYWSFNRYLFFAHIADVSAFILLVTSNKLSKRLLGVWWKRVQRLSYVYFYGSAIFLFFSYEKVSMLFYMVFITAITMTAFVKNRRRAIVQSVKIAPV